MYLFENLYFKLVQMIKFFILFFNTSHIREKAKTVPTICKVRFSKIQSMQAWIDEKYFDQNRTTKIILFEAWNSVEEYLSKFHINMKCNF